MSIDYLQSDRLLRSKAAYTTQRVDLHKAVTLLSGSIAPRSGDVVLARVEKLGHHRNLGQSNNARSSLFIGDEIIVCYGNRYAPDQFEAEIPEDLSACHLVAGGGVAARVISQHVRIRPPTVIQPLGLLGYEKGQRVNLMDWALQPGGFIGRRPLTYVVVGSSMNCGKTTTAAHLIRGLTTSGLRVGAAKITGTGSPGDPKFFSDAGADPVLDFTDAGFPSTYLTAPKEVLHIYHILAGHLAAAGVEVIVLEVADGILQEETRVLITAEAFYENVDGFLFAAADSLSAAAGADWFRRHDLPLLGVSGLITSSPLASREAALATQMPVLDLESLQQLTIAEFMREQCEKEFRIEMAS